MKTYTVYFSIGDKNLKMAVLATSAAEAQALVTAKLKVVKTVEEPLEQAEDVGGKSMLEKILDWMEEAVDKVDAKTKN